MFRWITIPQQIYNESYFASYLVVVFPLLVSASTITRSVPLRIGFLAAVVAYPILVFRIENRGAVLGLVAAIIVLLLTSSKLARRVLLTVVAIVVLTVVIPRTGVWERFEPLLERFDNPRILLWRSGWEMFLDHPVFGVGPGQFSNFVHLYEPSFNPAHKLDAHNSLVQMLAETGFPGLLLYCALFSIVMMYLFQMMGDPRTADWIKAVSRGLVAAFCGYLVVGLFASRHDLPLIYVLVGAALATRFCWVRERELRSGW